MNPRRFAAILLATFLAIASCTAGAPGGGGVQPPAGKPVSGGSITMVLENDVINFDPMLSTAFVDRNVHYQIYDSLVRIDSDGKIIPWLAESWKVSDDGKQVTFSLRKDVKYHDGSPFDAESVKWNIERYITGKGSFRAAELSSVASVEVADPATVRFNLKAPFSPLLANLVDRAGMMVSRKAADAGGADFTRKAFRAGTGPFVLTEAVKDDHITIEKNPTWWGKDKDGSPLPYLDKITIKPITDGTVRLTNLKTGDAHVANNIPAKDIAGVKADGTLAYKEKPAYSWTSLIPNRRAGMVFNDARYVRAVAMALDRQEILERINFGVGAVGYGPTAPNHFAYDSSFKPYSLDVEGAKKLVAEVGKGQLSFELLVSAGDPVLSQLGQLIQAQLGKADMKVDLKSLEFAQILDRANKGEFSGLIVLGWSGRVDPDGNIYNHVHSKGPNNYPGYKNAQVDALLDEQRTTSDDAKRRAAIRRAEQIYVVDDPNRIWYSFGIALLVTSKKLQGLEVYPDQLIRYQYAWLQQ